MVFWLAIGLLTLVALAAVLAPMYLGAASGRPDADTDEAAHDVAVYKDQIAEVARDLEAGLISSDEATGAQAEIGRRLLRASRKADAAPAAASDGQRWVVAGLSAVAAIGVAFGLYGLEGSPRADDQPLGERLAALEKAGKLTLGQQVALAERRIAANPRDAGAHEFLARAYIGQRRFADAALAFGNVIRILGPSSARLSDQAEALVMMNNQIVSRDARELFEEAVKLDPKDIRPRFFIALSLTQDGKSMEALEAWKWLLANTRDRKYAQLTRAVVRQIVELEQKLGLPSSIPKVDDMVAQIEKHLAAKPDDGEGWAVIAPVYFKLGRYLDAANAYANANRILGDTAERLAARGEALVFAEGRTVSDAARALFVKALALDPSSTTARAYLALRQASDAPSAETLGALRGLLPRAEDDDVWPRLARPMIAALEKRFGGSDGTTASGDRGPTAADVKAAGKMSDGDRREFIQGMVGTLAERLESEGGPPDQWIKLARSYTVLGDKDKAKAAYEKALKVFADKPEALASIREAGASLGLAP